MGVRIRAPLGLRKIADAEDAKFNIGDSVRVRGSALVYKVIALTNSMVTILVFNPQPDGTVLCFNPQLSVQNLDQSRLEKVT